MRQLKCITTKNRKDFHLAEVPEEFIFVQVIAKRHADTSEEAKIFYLKGIETVEQFKSVVSERTYHSKVGWIVEQAIKRAKIQNCGHEENC